MKTAGIVCEYNPMHNGHVYQIEQTKKAGATHIACVMSGNFVQRGDCAFADKWSRADIAVHCGADLVVLLPTAWSCDSAQNFAFGAVSVLNSLGIDMLSFGSECANKEKLEAAAKILQNANISDELSKYIKQGSSYPAALYASVCNFSGKETADILASPNNTLAVEYIKALNKLGSSAEIYPCQRVGAGHDETLECDGFLSANAIRSQEDFFDAKAFMPEYSFNKIQSLIGSGYAPCTVKNAEKAVIAVLRTMKKEDIAFYVNDNRGLAERIFAAVQSCISIEEICNQVKIKNITMSKIRRSLMRIFLKINPEISQKQPPYIRVLAANSKGFEIIKNATGNIPIVTKHSEILKLSYFAREVYEIECRSSDLYGLFSKKIRACSSEQTSPVIIV